MTPSATQLQVLTALMILLVLGQSVDGCFPGNTRMRMRRPRREPPLVYKEYDPNANEFSPAAAGPKEGRVRRSDGRFKSLTHNNNPDVIFKDEEKTDEDRLMTKRCKEKVDNLAMLVINYWPGVKLRVLEAWSEDGVHNPESLHYEGRAVDMTTSDRDKNKLGMLARLARQAGFDWVYYETRAHVHASVKADGAAGIKLRGCFSGDSTLSLPNGSAVAMRQLERNQLVQTVLADGTVGLSPVVAFLDRQTDVRANFLRLTTEQSSVTVTPYHLLYRSCANCSALQRLPTFAKDIRVGDWLLQLSGSGGVEPGRVVSVTETVGLGLFAPLTLEGNVVVDSLVASCYAGTQAEWLAHLSLWPLRFLHSLTSRLSQPGSLTPSDNGIHPYAQFLVRLNQYVRAVSV